MSNEYHVNDYDVIIEYEGEHFPGQVTKVKKNMVSVKCYTKANKQGSVWRVEMAAKEGWRILQYHKDCQKNRRATREKEEPKSWKVNKGIMYILFQNWMITGCKFILYHVCY